MSIFFFFVKKISLDILIVYLSIQNRSLFIFFTIFLKGKINGPSLFFHGVYLFIYFWYIFFLRNPTLHLYNANTI